MPGIPSQFLELPLRGGLSEATDPRWVEIGNQIELVNVSFVDDGAFSKRWGFSILSLKQISGTTIWGTTNASAGYRLGSYGNQLWQIGQNGGTPTLNTSIATYASQIDRWTIQDYCPETRAWRRPVVEWSTSTNMYDSVAGSGYVMTVSCSFPYNSSSVYQVYVSVYEYQTGAFLFQNMAVGTPGTNTNVARCIYVPSGTNGDPFFVLCWYDDTAGTDIWARSLNLTTMTWGTATRIVNDYDATSDNRNWDICNVDGIANKWAIVCFADQAGTPVVNLLTHNAALTQLATTTWAAPPGFNLPGNGIGITADANQIWVCQALDDGANTTLYVRAQDATTIATNDLATTSLGLTYAGTADGIRITGIYTSSTAATFVTSNRSATVGTRWRSITTAAALGTARRMYNTDIASKPFLQDSNWYATVAYNQNLVGYTNIGTVQTVTTSPQGTYFLIDLGINSASSSANVGRPCATLAPRIANCVSSVWSTTVCTNVGEVTDNIWITSGSVVGSTSTRFGLQALHYAFNGNRFESVRLGESLYFAAGTPFQFDGTQCREIGMLMPPPGAISLAASNGAGLMQVNGLYTYIGIYEQPNAKGELSRSASTVGAVQMGAADDTVTVTCNHNTVTFRQDPENSFSPAITFKLFRNTSASSTSVGSVFYQIAQDTLLPQSDPATYSQTFVDLLNDASLLALGAGRWPFGSQEIEPYCPGAIQSLRVLNGRLIGVGDDLQTIVYSTAYVIGEEPRFSDEFRLPCPDVITGLEVLDGTAYVFTEKQIFRFSGRGPNEQATQNDFYTGTPGTALIALPTDVGCSDGRSIVATPIGIFFQSGQGISILGRDGSPAFIGAAVKRLFASYPVIKAATQVADRSEVRWECQAEDGDTGICIVWNTLFKRWSWHERRDTDASLSVAPAESACVVGQTYYWANSAGAVYKESNSSYLDNGVWVTLRAKSAIAKAQALSGWALWRYVLVAGESMSPHDLNVSITTGETDLTTFRADNIDAWTTSFAGEFGELAECQVVDQRSPVLQVEVYDSTPSAMPVGSSGEGLKLLGLTLEVAMTGRLRFPRVQTA